MNVILLGPPGCGKGTQGALLAQELGAPRVSTGDLLRAAVKNGTPLGKKARDFMEQGLLVPDEVVLGLIEEVLASPQAARGIVMDGFPRTDGQAGAVEALLGKRGTTVNAAVLIDVDDGELVKRLRGRAGQEGRADDTPEAIARRLSVYREQTAPLIAYYRKRGKLREVPGTGTVEEIARRIRKALGI